MTVLQALRQFYPETDLITWGKNEDGTTLVSYKDETIRFSPAVENDVLAARAFLEVERLNAELAEARNDG